MDDIIREITTISQLCAFLVTDCAFDLKLSRAAAETLHVAAAINVTFGVNADASVYFDVMEPDAALKTLRKQWEIVNLVEKQAHAQCGSAFTVPAAKRVCVAIEALAAQIKAGKQAWAAELAARA